MKIPRDAKRVFKGVIFDVYQWEQEMFDGTKEIFEMLKRPDTIQVIATSKEKIIIGDEEQPHKGKFYSLIGGRAEEGEEPLETAKRELLEETGLVSDNWGLFFSYEPFTKFEWTIYTFIARRCKKVSEQKLDAGEKINVEEVTLEKFFEILDSDKFTGGELTHEIFKIRQDPKKLAEFKKKLFS